MDVYVQQEGAQAQEALWFLVSNPPLGHLRWGEGCFGSERVFIAVKSVNSGDKSRMHHILAVGLQMSHY